MNSLAYCNLIGSESKLSQDIYASKVFEKTSKKIVPFEDIKTVPPLDKRECFKV